MNYGAMKMIRKTISLTEQQAEWLQAQINSGQYATESEAVRELIRRETNKDHNRELIRAALIEAESCGFDSQTFDDVVDRAIARKKRQDEM